MPMRTITAATSKPRPRQAVSAAAAAAPTSRTPAVSKETLQTSRQVVQDLLQRTPAFNQLDAEKRKQLAHGLVQIASQLAEPGGKRLTPAQMNPQVRALAESGFSRTRGSNTDQEGKFVAQAA